MNKLRQQLVKHRSKLVDGRPKRKYSLYKKLLRPENEWRYHQDIRSDGGQSHHGKIPPTVTLL